MTADVATLWVHAICSAVIGAAALALAVETPARGVGWRGLRVLLALVAVASLGSAVAIGKLALRWEAAYVQWLLTGWSMWRLTLVAVTFAWGAVLGIAQARTVRRPPRVGHGAHGWR